MDPKHVLVADVMSVDPVVVRVDASLAEADVVLRSTYITGIPVVDRNGELVGVLSHAYRLDLPAVERTVRSWNGAGAT